MAKIDVAIKYAEHLVKVLHASKKDGRKQTRHQRRTRTQIVLGCMTQIAQNIPLPKLPA
jgi:hypothetical protein